MGNTTRQELLEQLNQMMDKMQYLVEHPRTQQKRWVSIAASKWLPLLRLIRAELEHGSIPDVDE